MVSLKRLHETYGHLLHMEEQDYDRLDCNLAAALGIKMKGVPIWLINIGPSGGNKSGLTYPLSQWSKVHKEEVITANTLVSGNPKVKDLAPNLDGKVLFIADMAQLLTLHPTEKGKVWSQLRDLYDGFAGKSSGAGARKHHPNLYVGFIANATSSIDNQILIHSNLGTRELLYRYEGSNQKEDLMDVIITNEALDRNKEISEELADITVKFLNNIKPEDKQIDAASIRTIKNITLFASKMRATGSFSYSHELLNPVQPEEPTRLLRQLIRLYKLLLNLDKKYDPKKALRIIEHVAKSSAPPMRVTIYEMIVNSKVSLTTADIYNTLKVGRSQVQRELAVLQNVNLIHNKGEGYHTNWVKYSK